MAALVYPCASTASRDSLMRSSLELCRSECVAMVAAG